MSVHRAILTGLVAASAAAACADAGVPTDATGPAVATTVEVTAAKTVLASLGETTQLTAVVLDQHGRQFADQAVSWSSSSSAVATVSSTGLVSAVADGVAVVTASIGAVNGSVELQVDQVAVALAWHVQPLLVELGKPMGRGVSVLLLDGLGSLVADGATEVTLALTNNDCGATLTGSLTQAAQAGIATFSGLVLNAAGWGYRLSASAPEMAAAVSARFGVWAQGLWKGATWLVADNMVRARRDHSASLLRDGQVLVAGWADSETEVYDPVTGSFSLGTTMSIPHGQGFSATTLGDGRILFVGGTESPRTTELYDQESSVFTSHLDTKADRRYHTATVLDDGRILFAGGQVDGPETHRLAEIFDPLDGSFTLTDSLTQDRAGHGAVRLPDGRVLVLGGGQSTTAGFGNLLKSAEIYDPVTGQFTDTDRMTEPHLGAVLLPDQTVLAWGAFDSADTEIYDPTSSSFSPGPRMSQRHSAGVATTLPDGSILITGGNIGVGPITTSGVDLYDPVTHTFVSVAPMSVDRQEHAATLLGDGRVLVTGGFGEGTLQYSAELLTPAPCYVP